MRDELAPVFKLSHIRSLYANRLKEFGVDKNVNHTHLKKRLLAVIPALRAQNHGKEILLVYGKDIGSALNVVCDSNTVVACTERCMLCSLLCEFHPFFGRDYISYICILFTNASVNVVVYLLKN